MSKFSIAVYPVVVAFSLAAAASAHAQSVNDPYDHAGYGPTLASPAVAPKAAAKPVLKADVTRITIVGRHAAHDVADQAAYGPTPVPAGFVRTRAEVRAEALAAVQAGEDILNREGVDPQYAVLLRKPAVTRPAATSAAE